MGFIKYWGGVKMFKGDEQAVEICKLREDNTCHNCNKALPKGTFVVGSGGIKNCLDCGESFYREVEDGVRDFLKHLKIHRDDFTKNKDKYKMENLAHLI